MQTPELAMLWVFIFVLALALFFAVERIRDWFFEGRAKLERIITIVTEIREEQRNDPNQ